MKKKERGKTFKAEPDFSLSDGNKDSSHFVNNSK